MINRIKRHVKKKLQPVSYEYHNGGKGTLINQWLTGAGVALVISTLLGVCSWLIINDRTGVDHRLDRIDTRITQLVGVIDKIHDRFDNTCLDVERMRTQLDYLDRQCNALRSFHKGP